MHVMTLAVLHGTPVRLPGRPVHAVLCHHAVVRGSTAASAMRYWCFIAVAQHSDMASCAHVAATFVDDAANPCQQSMHSPQSQAAPVHDARCMGAKLACSCLWCVHRSSSQPHFTYLNTCALQQYTALM